MTGGKGSASFDNDALRAAFCAGAHAQAAHLKRMMEVMLRLPQAEAVLLEEVLARADDAATVAALRAHLDLVRAGNAADLEYGGIDIDLVLPPADLAASIAGGAPGDSLCVEVRGGARQRAPENGFVRWIVDGIVAASQ
jgi:hypothetical protein